MPWDIGLNLFNFIFQDGSRFGVRIHYSQEKERLGTAGPVRLARDRFGISEPVLIMNADIITNVNFEDLYGWHRKREPAITVGVRWLEGEVPYGVVEMKEDEVRSIVERPRHSCLINCGIYVVNPEVLDLVPEGEFYVPDLIQAAMGAGHRVCGYEIREKWVSIDDIGDLEDEVNRIDPK